ncbi:MAG: hypothetical protein M2R45_01323 [Verrucomicrobia subdivision 3 bacterium]|nr:hypothetical protein [Limisphaerales bacterium]MCS1415189.1 hypothetical protein [Limisphaerales bacterium]
MLHLELKHATTHKQARITTHDMHNDLNARLTHIALQGELIQRDLPPTSELDQNVAKITGKA